MATILVVDDRAINREFLVTLLGYVGHEVLEAEDGVAALEVTRARRPDLIITDVLMPNMDGVEFADRVHDDPDIAGTPIIFYTATYRVPEASVLAQSCRVAIVLAKPAEPQTVLDAVAAALGTGPAPVLMPQQATAPPSFLGAQLPSYLRDLTELQQRLRRVFDSGVEDERAQVSTHRTDPILTSYQALGLRMAALLELGMVLSSERDPQQLLDLFCRGAQDIMNCKCAIIAVLEADEQRLRDCAARGLSEVQLSQLAAVDLRDGILADILADGKPRRLRGSDDVAKSGIASLVPEAESMLLVPLPLQSTVAVRGYLCFCDRVGPDAFDDEDEQFGMTLAAQLALAYGNLVMYDEIQRRATELEIEIVERRRAQTELAHRITHDQTTGVPRFVVIETYLQSALTEAAAQGGHVLVCYVDIDYFHTVNETRGRSAGDHVLRCVAERLAALVGEQGRLAHVAADEFVLILHEPCGPSDPARLGETIRAAIEKPVQDGQERIYVTCSVGVCDFPDSGGSPQELVRRAEAAMMRAKREGRNSVLTFSHDLNQRLQDRLSLGPRLRDAIRDGHLVLHYQPLVSASDFRVIGFEALVRWQSPEFGLLLPGRFLQVAEEFGLTADIGNFVIESACRQARAWLDEKVGEFSIAINVSASHMQRAGFADTVRAALEGWELPARCIELELTEGMMTENVERMIATMHVLKEIGVGLSLDDFGTGYSSLNYLRRFPIDKLKIDQSFVRDISVDPGAASICRSIVGLGHQLGMIVLAEGVETAEQVDYLRRASCDQFQGFYFEKPVPASQAVHLLQQEADQLRHRM